VAYRIPLPHGAYRLRVHFAETEFRQSSQRFFEVVVEGKRLFGDEDFSARFATACSLRTPVDVADGYLDVGFLHVLADPEIAALEIVAIQ
jgi:hypothetical protein